MADQGWDIVLCDFHMPRFSGTEALKIVREQDPDVPFIFVSGAIGEDVAVGAMKAGAQDYVMKGNLKRLAPAIERELRDAAVRRERATAEIPAAHDGGALPPDPLHRARCHRRDGRSAAHRHVQPGRRAPVRLQRRRSDRPERRCPAAGPVRRAGPGADPAVRRVGGRDDADPVPDKFCGRRKNGMEFPAEAYVSKMVEERRTIFTAIIRDITERENMMATLRQTNQTLDAVVQSSPVAILGLDSSRRVIVWNRNAERIFGTVGDRRRGPPLPVR